MAEERRMNHGAEAEMSLKSIFDMLLRRIWLIVLVPMFTVIITAAIVFFAVAPKYTATVSLYVLNKQSTDNATVNYSDLQSSTLLTADYSELIMSKRVLSTVGAAYGIDHEQLRDDYNVKVSNANNTRIIEVSVTSKDPALAANLANSIGSEFARAVVEIMDADNVNFVDIAEPPVEPSAPKKVRTIAVAGIVSLIAAASVALAIELLNNTIRTQEDVESKLGLPVLARVPKYEVK